MNAFEEERAQNTKDQNELRSAIGALEEEIRTAEDAAKQARQGKPGGERRKDVTHMETNETRTRFFGLTIQQRDTFLAREDVSGFLSRAAGDAGPDPQRERSGVGDPHSDA